MGIPSGYTIFWFIHNSTSCVLNFQHSLQGSPSLTDSQVPSTKWANHLAEPFRQHSPHSLNVCDRTHNLRLLKLMFSLLFWKRVAVPRRERDGKSVRIVVGNDYGSAGHVAKITTLFRQSTCVDSGSIGRLFGQDKAHRERKKGTGPTRIYRV